MDAGYNERGLGGRELTWSAGALVVSVLRGSLGAAAVDGWRSAAGPPEFATLGRAVVFRLFADRETAPVLVVAVDRPQKCDRPGNLICFNNGNTEGTEKRMSQTPQSNLLKAMRIV